MCLIANPLFWIDPKLSSGIPTSTPEDFHLIRVVWYPSRSDIDARRHILISGKHARLSTIGKSPPMSLTYRPGRCRWLDDLLQNWRLANRLVGIYIGRGLNSYQFTTTYDIQRTIWMMIDFYDHQSEACRTSRITNYWIPHGKFHLYHSLHQHQACLSTSWLACLMAFSLSHFNDKPHSYLNFSTSPIHSTIRNSSSIIWSTLQHTESMKRNAIPNTSHNITSQNITSHIMA